jgi:hypothetical protein
MMGQLNMDTTREIFMLEDQGPECGATTTESHDALLPANMAARRAYHFP